MPPKLSVPNVLFEILLEAWRADGWTVKYHLQPHRKEPTMLATPDENTRTVLMYPHPPDIPPEKTGLHEMIHIRLHLSGERRHEEITYFLEDYLWARLTKKQRALLYDIFVKPLHAKG